MDALDTRETLRLTPEQRAQIQQAYLLDDTSMSALARRFKVDRSTVKRCLSGEDYEALRKEAHASRKREVLDVLSRAAVKAAEQWTGPTLKNAAKKGQHKPMEDLLKAGGFIEQADGPRIVVQVGVKLVGGPE